MRRDSTLLIRDKLNVIFDGKNSNKKDIKTALKKLKERLEKNTELGAFKEIVKEKLGVLIQKLKDHAGVLSFPKLLEKIRYL